MKTDCIIVDDEPLAIDLLRNHLGQFAQVNVKATFTKPLEAFEFLKSNHVDLIFLDIQMPGLTGLNFLRAIKNPPKAIITTAYRDYALEGFELNVVDYLLKPITFERFLKAIDKYFELHKAPTISVNTTKSDEKTGLFIRSEKKNVRVVFDDILYIESIKDYIKIHLADKQITSKDRISHFEESLPDFFIRIHRSFIVNSKKITAFTNNDIEINKLEIPIGGFYKKSVHDRLS